MHNTVLSRHKNAEILPKLYALYAKPALEAGIFMVLLGLSATIEASGIKSALSVEELKELTPIIEAVEKQSYNLKIESETWVETKADPADPCESWQRTPVYVSSTAWIEGGNPFVGHVSFANTRVRVDVHREVLKWEEGVAPYEESSYTISFDGQYGRILYHASGPIGDSSPVRKGELLSKPPDELAIGWWPRFTGAEFSISFFLRGREDTLSNICRSAADPSSLVGSFFEFTRETFQGVRCIKITAKGKKASTECWWIDPSRGFALLGHKITGLYPDGTERLILSMEVTKLKEVTDGTWWPVQATLISRPLKLGDLYRRTVYRASNVVANDANVAQTIFTVPFPDGYLIDDKVKGVEYRAGEEQQTKK